MCRYFFNIRTGDENLIIDDEGLELSGLDQVLAEAVAGAKDLLKEAINKGEPIGKEQFEVTDEAGRLALIYPVRNAIRLQ